MNGPLQDPIEWMRVTDKDELEKHLNQRNKRHLQQMAMEDSPPSQDYFQPLLEN